MQFRFTRTRDTLGPGLLAKLKTASDPRPALQAAGLVIESHTKRAFDEPSLRPAAWPARKRAAAHRLLKRTGTLWRSIRITELLKTRVTIGTDREYARFHQLGTKSLPARPFFPFTPDGRLMPATKARVEAAIRKKVG